MNDQALAVLVVVGALVGLPWLILHYVTKWKTAPKITDEDERLLDEMQLLARRLEDRVLTVERIIAAARVVLVRDGYESFTTNRVADEAEAVPARYLSRYGRYFAEFDQYAYGMLSTWAFGIVCSYAVYSVWASSAQPPNRTTCEPFTGSAALL